MEKLIELGFRQSARVEIVNDNLLINIENNDHTSNLLYAFILVNGEEMDNWHVRYIGHTRKSFKNRMYGYQLGNGKAVNNRIHIELKNHCKEERKILVYTLTDIINLNLHSLFIDVAAGLEYSLIEFYQEFNNKNNHPPLQNIAGNKKLISLDTETSELLEIEEKIEEEKKYNLETKLDIATTFLGSFEQNLDKTTYWDYSFINIPTKLSEYFGQADETVSLSIVSFDGKIINELSLPINRTANITNTPRLHIQGQDGKWFQEWKHLNFTKNDKLKFDILSKNTIAIFMK
jgi:hypothetical protein